MEEFIMLAGGFGRLVAIFGGTVSAVFIAWAGVLWIFSAGDPQAIARARMALIGVVVGLVVVGASFLVPGVVSEVVIEPVGGMPVEVRSGYDCDAILRTQLVAQVNVNTPERMQGVIQRIQAKRKQCHVGAWSPRVKVTSGVPEGCEDGAEGSRLIENVQVAKGLLLTNGGAVPLKSTRDRDNNVIVYWDWAGSDGDVRRLPSDSAVCWMYVSEYRGWYSGHAR